MGSPLRSCRELIKIGSLTLKGQWASLNFRLCFASGQLWRKSQSMLVTRTGYSEGHAQVAYMSP